MVGSGGSQGRRFFLPGSERPPLVLVSNQVLDPGEEYALLLTQ